MTASIKQPEDVKVQFLPVAALLPYARNSKDHSPAQIEIIAGSIERFGWTNPCLVADGTIIAGHGRVMAAKKLGLERVPCIDISHLSEIDRRAYVVMDNRSAEVGASWNLEILKLETDDLRAMGIDLEAATGFAEEDLAKLFEGMVDPESPGAGADPDDVPDVPVVPHSRLGDVWEVAGHRIMCGSSLETKDWDVLMAGEQADCVFTDPPYGVSIGEKQDAINKVVGKNGRKTKGQHLLNDDLTGGDLYDFISGALGQIMLIMKPGAPIYVYFSWMRAVPFLKAFFDNGFKFQTVLLWKKNSFVLSRLDHHYITEPAIYGWSPGAGHKWFGGRKQHNVFDLGASGPFQKQDDGRVALVHGDCAYAFRPDALIDEVPTNVFSVPRPQRSELHPTQKPVELVMRHIRNSARSGDIVVDAFGGAGSTAVAAHQLGMHSRLMELDPKCVDVIVRRLEMFTGSRAVHAVTGEMFPSDGEVRAPADLTEPAPDEDDGQPF